MQKLLFSTIFIFAVFCSVQGQKIQVDSSDHINFFSADIGYHIPEFDMKEWFNNNAAIGATFGIKTAGNWTFGVDFSYLWSDGVRNQDSVLKTINNSDGNIIDGNGQYAIINYYESGWTGMFTVGKVFPVSKVNKNSGIWIRGGIGFLQHKILINNLKNVAPQIKGEYKKGYDKLSNGFAASQFVGYLWISKRSAVNAYAGFEFIEGWTKSRRTTDFNTGLYDSKQKFDLLMGLKIGIIIPVFKRSPDPYYFN